jgi:hypothetical protein
VRARWVVLATGAVPQGLMAAGLCDPPHAQRRGAARLRAPPGLVGRMTALEMVWHKQLRGGYGWIFPVPGRRVQHRRRPDRQPQVAGGRAAATMQDVNLRQMFDAFCAGLRAGRRTDGAAARCRVTEGRAAALLAGRRALVSRPGCWPPAKPSAAPTPSPAKASARRWRPACWRPRRCWPPCRRRTRGRHAWPLRGRAAALKPRFDLYEQGQQGQPPPLAGRPGDLARQPQPAHPAAHGRRAGGDAEPRPVSLLAWPSGITKLLTE